MDTSSGGRSRRSLSAKKSSRLAALEKLSKVRKGLTNDKYNIKNEEDVFELVDEDEYDDLKKKRQEEDWIVPDDGADGYVEDGREIFDEGEDDYIYDDDDENEATQVDAKSGKSKKKQPPKRPVDGEEAKKPDQKTSVKSFVLAHYAKEKKDDKADPSSQFDSSQVEPQGDPLLDPHALLAPASRPMKLNNKLIKFNSNQSSPSLTQIKPKESQDTGSQKRKLDDVDFDSCVEPCVEADFYKDIDKVVQKRPRAEETNYEKEGDGLAAGENDPAFELEGEENFTYWLDGIVEVKAKTVVDEEGIPFIKDREGNKYLKMFWLDAHEDPYSYPGRVYIFGKIKAKANAISGQDYLSCCLIVEDIGRRVFLLPKKQGEARVPISEVQEEFRDKVAKSYRIKNFKSKSITKFYSFEDPNVPYQSDYLEVLYPANYPALSAEVSAESFTRVFNTTQSSLERLILEIGMKGPGWLLIREPQSVGAATSWCKKEFKIKYSVKDIKVDDEDTTIPPLTLCSINVKTHLNHLVAISCLVKRDYQIDGGKPSNLMDLTESFCSVTLPPGHVATFPSDFERVAKSFVPGKKEFIKIFTNEHFMLNQFLVTLGKIDPDVVIGHDSSFDISAILARQAHYNDKINWSRLGRLRRTILKSSMSQKDKMTATSGRLICDIQIMAKELIRAKSYDLDELISHVLKKQRVESPTNIAEAYTDSKSLLAYLNAFLADNRFILSIMYELDALPLALEITRVAGNVFSRTLMGGRAERNEYLLCHAFHEKNFILPDKKLKKFGESKTEVAVNGQDKVDPNSNPEAKTSRKKAAYSGGLVLEPKVGFYDSFILLMDFNSLYPSIIQEYNICFTTVSKDKNKMRTDENGEEIPDVPEPDKPQGILPTEICKLVETRREVKRLMMEEKAPELKNQLNIKQLALKLTANSMYGCLGFSHSRFHAQQLAALITFKGREILMHTKNLVETMGLEVIYGDTDSIMINTTCSNYDEVIRTGRKVQMDINKIYKLLEIDIDGVYRPMLLLKKKKYAAMALSKQGNTIKKTKEMKGLDIVRRDWSMLAKRIGEKILDVILSGESNQDVVDSIHIIIKEVAEFVKAGVFNNEQLKEFEITKQLTKNPEDYQDAKSLPHVLVALKRNSNSKVERKLRAGDVVPYVICVEESNSSFNALPNTQRAFHPDELCENDKLKIDANYYLSQQILPVAIRLCEPIEGTDAHIMAEIMGIESTSIHRSSRDEEDSDLITDKESQYDSCQSLKIPCPNGACKKVIEFRTTFKIDEVTKKKLNVSLARCPHCKCSLTSSAYENRISNEFNLLLKKLLDTFYENWHVCQGNCGYRTRCCWGYYDQRKNSRGLLCACTQYNLDQEITDVQLYKQFEFYKHLLDLPEALKSISSESERSELEKIIAPSQNLYKRLLASVIKVQKTMAYTTINLGDIFKDQIFSCVKKLAH